MLKRILLFFAINFLVVFTISFVLQILNVRPYLEAYGLNYSALLIFCLVWGMGGAFISLLLSKQMAKWLLGVRIVDPETSDPELHQLLKWVEELSRNAGLARSPEVGVYSSNEVNAFATGATKNRSLIAVSTGLLNRMNPDEIQAVIGHELSHVTNGDMVTMTLLQGIVNAFVMFLARIFAYILSGMGKNRNEQPSYGSYNLFVFLFEIVFMFFGFMVLAVFSRYREYRADRGGARLAGKEKMIQALQALRVFQEIRDPAAQATSLQSFKISSFSKKGLSHLFATHPSLEQRIERLQRE